MADFVVNVTLIVALFVLLVVWAVSASRRRRRDRREHAQERRLILDAFTAAAGGAPADEYDEDGDLEYVHAELDSRSQAERPARRSRSQQASRPSARTSARRLSGAAAQQLDPASIVALLDLIEDRKPARRGAFASLFTSPGSVWSAGVRAGQSVARNTMGDPGAGDQIDATADAQLYREAAGELVDIYAHDPADARAQYAKYAAAIGDPAMAELYVRSAVYATYADHDEVAQLVEDITGGEHGPDLSDGATTIDA
jgi:hypothetical protein